MEDELTEVAADVEPTDDGFDFDVDGEQVRVPGKLKSVLDAYKTLSGEREDFHAREQEASKGFEKIKEILGMQDEHYDAITDYKIVDRLYKQFQDGLKGVNVEELQQQNPEELLRLAEMDAQLKDALKQAGEQVQSVFSRKKENIDNFGTELNRKARREMEMQLQKEDPRMTLERLAKIADFAETYSPALRKDVLMSVVDPGAIKLLDLAYSMNELNGKQKEEAKASKKEPAKKAEEGNVAKRRINPYFE